MSDLIEFYGVEGTKVMIFVDGENLAIRYKNILSRRGLEDSDKACFEPDVFVLAQRLSGRASGFGIVRRHYYTSVQGDHPRLDDVADRLKAIGVEAPRVFKKQKGIRSKRVDISLATEMLLHATRRHYEIAVLAAGDEDYVPLVEAVKAEGCRVHVWFVKEGLSPILARTADHFLDIEEILLERLWPKGEDG